MAEEVGHPFTMSLIIYMFAMIHQASGRVQKTRRECREELIEFCEKAGVEALLNKGGNLSRLGHFRRRRPAGGRRRDVGRIGGAPRDRGQRPTHTYHIAILAKRWGRLANMIAASNSSRRACSSSATTGIGHGRQTFTGFAGIFSPRERLLMRTLP